MGYAVAVQLYEEALEADSTNERARRALHRDTELEQRQAVESDSPSMTTLLEQALDSETD